MRRSTPRAAALLGAAAIAVSFAGPASAGTNTYCFKVEPVQAATYPRPVSTQQMSYCVPWPF